MILHMNHRSVTSLTKRVGNVGNWATSNDRVCGSRKSQNFNRRRKDEKPNLPSFEVDDERDDGSLVALLEVNNVNQVAAGDVIWVKTKINGHILKMELDTDSAISTLPLQEYRQGNISKHTTGGHNFYFENLLRREDKTRRKTACSCGTKRST